MQIKATSQKRKQPDLFTESVGNVTKRAKIDSNNYQPQPSNYCNVNAIPVLNGNGNIIQNSQYQTTKDQQRQYHMSTKEQQSSALKQHYSINAQYQDNAVNDQHDPTVQYIGSCTPPWVNNQAHGYTQNDFGSNNPTTVQTVPDSMITPPLEYKDAEKSAQKSAHNGAQNFPVQNHTSAQNFTYSASDYISTVPQSLITPLDNKGAQNGAQNLAYLPAHSMPYHTGPSKVAQNGAQNFAGSVFYPVQNHTSAQNFTYSASNYANTVPKVHIPNNDYVATYYEALDLLGDCYRRQPELSTAVEFFNASAYLAPHFSHSNINE